MLRSFSACALVCGALYVAGASLCFAVDKTPAPTDDTEAREQVRQALVAETQGDNTLRARKLGQALLAAPDLDAANWQLARVKRDKAWLPLVQAEEQAAADPAAIDYQKRRAKLGKSAKQLRDLARHCTKLGWSDMAQLHYAQLLGHADATKEMREEAIQRLELVQTGGAWIKKDEVAAREAEAKAIQESLAKWRPKLKALQQLIDGPDFAKRDKAIEQLTQLDDPQMIPALESFLLDAKADFQEQAVKRLATFPHYEATEALVRYAVLPESVIVRDAAIEALKQRPLHEYCPLLIDALIAPVKSQFVFATNRQGSVVYAVALDRETQHEKQVLRFSTVRMPAKLQRRLGIIVPAHPKDPQIPGVTESVVDGVARRAVDVELEVRNHNSLAKGRNDPVFHALHGATGQNLPATPQSWWNWWQEFNEYTWPKPTKYAFKSHIGCYIQSVGMSCFLAGTPVRTQAGLAAIETIQPGDRVLAQDQDTGELTYKLVLRTTLRPPAKMVRIAAGSEQITTTLGHPFWVSGHGWRMAKELKAGDRLHSHGGAVEVASIEELAKPEPAHNLVVADFNSYFVGNQGLLVHDNEFRQPTRAIVPGLLAADK